MIIELQPLGGPPAIFLVDAVPGFIALRIDEILSKFRIALETVRVEEELLHQKLCDVLVNDFALSITEFTYPIYRSRLMNNGPSEESL